MNEVFWKAGGTNPKDLTNGQLNKGFLKMNDTQKPRGAGKSSFELIDAHRLAAPLPLKEGAVVLDLACGSGAYSLLLSDIVGDAGLVYAADIWRHGLLHLEKQIETLDIKNVMPLVADLTQPVDIGDGSLDLCLMATVLHDFEAEGQTDAVLRQVKRMLKPQGWLVIVEFKKIEGPPGPPLRIRLSEAEVERLVTGYGFEKHAAVDIGDFNYLMIFQSVRV